MPDDSSKMSHSIISAESSTAPSLSSFSGRSSLETSPETTPPSSPDLHKRSSLRTQEIDDFPASFPPVPPNGLIPEVDAKDEGTPDAWINRDPRIVRLTGKVRDVLLSSLDPVAELQCEIYSIPSTVKPNWMIYSLQ